MTEQVETLRTVSAIEREIRDIKAVIRDREKQIRELKWELQAAQRDATRDLAKDATAGERKRGPKDAVERIVKAMKSKVCEKYGVSDSEPKNCIMDALEAGRLPKGVENPFALFSSCAGWKAAHRKIANAVSSALRVGAYQDCSGKILAELFLEAWYRG